MYTTALNVHSWFRYVVLALGLIAVFRALTAGRRAWTPADHRAATLFGISLDIQALIGLILYFLLSPFTREALRNFSAAMSNSGLRFSAVEHPFGMFIAIALVHIGKARIRKASNDARKHRLAAIFFSLAIIIMLLTIPWPGMRYGRPLFRW